MQLQWTHYKAWLGDQLVGDFPDTPAPAVSLWNRDTRTLEAGQWYLPIVGESFDGHQFIAKAVDQGAAGFLYQVGSNLPSELQCKGFAVKDTLVAIQRIAHGWRHAINTRFIALTGSAGKTTVKELLHLIMASSGKTVSTYGSYNNELGVPLTLISVPADTRFAILEMGARKPGDIAFLAKIADPDVGAVLNVGSAHLGIFGSRDNLLHTKTEMFRDSPQRTILVAPAFDEKVKAEARKTGKRVITFGQNENAHLWIDNIEWHADGTQTFDLCHSTRTYKISLQVSHEMYPQNACAAAAIAFAAGLDPALVPDALANFSGLEGRYKMHRKRSQVVIDDSYNANPESTKAGLTSLHKSFAGKKTLLVLGDMLEMGDDSPAIHHQVGAFAARETKPDAIWTVGQYAGDLAAGARDVSPSLTVQTFPDVAACINDGLPRASDYEVIYIKGSNGIRLNRLLAKLVGTA